MEGTLPTTAPSRGSLLSLFGLAAFAAGFLGPFTVSLVGEMPVGELVLLLVNAALLVMLLSMERLPGKVFRSPLFWVLVACQVAALGGYVIADLYRESSTRDMLRGWARMIFQLNDLIALSFLISQTIGNYVLLMLGMAVGGTAQAIVVTPKYDDFWKFGIGVPLTVVALLIAGKIRPWLTIPTAFALAGAHYLQDFRSMSVVCVFLAGLLLIQMLPRFFRLPLLLGAGAASALLAFAIFQHASDSSRATRSNVERSAMLAAAMNAVRQSPIIGHGSWFSNTRVMDDFLSIRAEEIHAQPGGRLLCR
jgi:hypothetical protein